MHPLRCTLLARRSLSSPLRSPVHLTQLPPGPSSSAHSSCLLHPAFLTSFSRCCGPFPCPPAMAARQTPYFAFELAVRLLHDYPWHPPPGLTATVAWRAAAIAGLYAAVEKLVLRPALLFTAWYFPGLRGLLGDALGGRAEYTGASTVAFLVVSRWRTGARLAGPEVVTAAALYAWAVVAVWVARGLAVLLQAALPPPIRPTGEVD
ncbi:hypothetical protein I4F81_002359 [Pyropia yezoensis]|uniref:Uncharacterized protein n=1 Tax=Pyropia yezoensis TaxID=2788 RepID=A0ACC3BPE6_PYRYE|nr:hypothetical protein I4F81_002359 [Neopyropia yezoensis]